MRHHSEAIEVDLLRYYQIDIARHLGTPKLSYRRLKALLRALPRDSQTMIAIHGVDDSWTLDQHLAAMQVDAIRFLRHAFVQSKSKGRIAAPTPIKRPGVDNGETESKTLGTVGYDPEELRRRLHETKWVEREVESV